MEIKKRIRIKMTFTEEILASLPSDKEIYNTYIASKLPPEQEFDIAELDAIDVDREIEKGTTIFPINKDEEACIYDYQIKGFFKGSCGLLREKGGKDPSSKLTAYKKKIDGKIFVFPRLIPLHVPDGEYIEICQRPLRAETAQGPRTALASSEAAPAGTWIEFDICLLSLEVEDALMQWLDYGALNGVGQWHNSGKGRFYYEIIEVIEGEDLNEYIKTGQIR